MEPRNTREAQQPAMVRYSKTQLAAMLLLAIGAASAQSITPLAVGLMADVFTEDLNTIGLVSSAGLVGATLSCLFVHSFLNRIAPVRIITLGLVISVLNNVTCSLASSFELFLAVRFLAGFGDGVIGVTISVLLAASYKPSRDFGLLVFGMFSTSIVIFQLAPVLIEPGQGRLLYRGFFVVMMLLSPLILLLPGRRVAAGRHGARFGGVPGGRNALLILAVIMTFFLGQGIYFTYAQLIGQEFGIASADVVDLLTWGSFFALVGAAWTTGFGDRFNKRWVVVGVSAALAAIIFCTYGIRSYGVYSLSVGLFNLLTMVAAPLFMAILAMLDPSGRLVVWGIVMQTASLSLGPVTAAPLIDQGHFAPTLLLAALLFATACLLALRFEPAPVPLSA